MNLEELLEQAAKNADARITFLNALINAEVFVIGTKAEQKEPQPDGTPALNMLSIRHKENNNVVPFFSSEEALKRFAVKVAPGNAPMATVKCIDFFKIILANKAGAIFNLGSTVSKEFAADEIKNLMDNLTQGVAVPSEGVEGNVVVSIPKEYPEEFIKEIRKFCGSRLDIRAAYLFDMVYPGGNAKHLLVVDPEFNRPEIFDKMHERITHLLADKADEYELMSAREPFCQSFLRGQKPFYAKSGI